MVYTAQKKMKKSHIGNCHTVIFSSSKAFSFSVIPISEENLYNAM